MERQETDSSHADDLINLIRRKWALLREKEFAADYPIEILRDQGANSVNVIEVFRWKSKQDQIRAGMDVEYRQLEAEIDALTANRSKRNYTEAVRGFNTNFPSIGGVELLKGVCSCLLSIDGMVENFPMSVKNGIVLMHRSPRMDLDGDGLNEMYLKILMHGGEIIQGALGPIRVEQNFSLPNDGLVKSNGEGAHDFPGTAVWRVSWRILTSRGPILTDPATPLIFGPARVNHYPPVGTRFHASMGPVALFLESSGERVGTLTPRELTAFDIVVTKDDEIYADLLNNAPPDLFKMVGTPANAAPILEDATTLG